MLICDFQIDGFCLLLVLSWVVYATNGTTPSHINTVYKTKNKNSLPSKFKIRHKRSLNWPLWRLSLQVAMSVRLSVPPSHTCGIYTTFHFDTTYKCY